MTVAGRQATIVVLVLAGLAVGSLAGAATSLAISLSPNPFAVTEIVFWLLGSLEDRSRIHVVLAAPFILVASAMLLSAAPGLRALSLGEETARASASISPACDWLIVACGGDRDRAPPSRWRARSASSASSRRISIRPFVGYDPARTLVPAGLAGARCC